MDLIYCKNTKLERYIYINNFAFISQYRLFQFPFKIKCKSAFQIISSSKSIFCIFEMKNPTIIHNKLQTIHFKFIQI